ncbi:putative cytochrome P450 [Lyophyllum shimeji]|uniref:Cytochrome P450 n=1 Tax=Lyophyllum shimeji TaxID=47721 RepID=A0A9P3PQZ4_LYOSH|nr:putative cytochrome P450 [Lyophyllum shimeji]
MTLTTDAFLSGSNLRPAFQLLCLALVSAFTLRQLRAYIHAKHISTPLSGPPSASLLFGVQPAIFTWDPAAVYERWVNQYGPIFRFPRGILASDKLVITDLKAVTSFLARDTWTYIQPQLQKDVLEAIIGGGVLVAEGEDHRRLRRVLTPGFSNAALRRFTTSFVDSAHKVKNLWEAQYLSESGQGIIEIQGWMNHAALDSIGIAGFSYDVWLSYYLYILHNDSPFFLTVRKDRGFMTKLIIMIGAFAPSISRLLPSQRNTEFKRIRLGGRDIAHKLLDRARKEKEAGTAHGENSLIGLLVKAEMAEGDSIRMTPEDVLAHNTLIVAGFESSSSTLTWILVYLSKNPHVQDRLREEINTKLGSGDPTWDTITYDMPYLAAVVQETLRLHPSVGEVNRIAQEDDVLPLSTPFIDAKGREVSEISVAKGTTVTVPITYINKSTELWGETAKDFRPERWLNDGAEIDGLKAKDISGWRHILTFSDGPRICIGRNFALAEIKAVLVVLIRHFVFELPDGPKTQITYHQGLVKRAKIIRATSDDEEGANVELKVTRIEF